MWILHLDLSKILLLIIRLQVQNIKIRRSRHLEFMFLFILFLVVSIRFYLCCYYYASYSLYNNIVKIQLRSKIKLYSFYKEFVLIYYYVFFIWIQVWISQTSILNSNSSRLALIHTNQLMYIESLDSTQNNSNFVFLHLKIWIHFEIWISIPTVELCQNSTLEFNFNQSNFLKPKF
jgi:hypothetical protein